MQFIGDFYIILPSNVNAPEFPNNKTNNYITPLPYPIELPGEWECGIAEINYCHSWYNINRGENEIKYAYKLKDKKRERIKIIEPAYYSDEQALVNILNKRKPNGFQGDFRFSLFNHKFQLILAPHESIVLTKQLATLMGFKRTSFDCVLSNIDFRKCYNVEQLDKNTDFLVYTADYTSDLNANIHSMFIYTDIVRETLVGNIYAPLLRNVNVVPKNDTYVQRSFDHIHYMKLNSNRINNIEIKICDSLGELIKFNFGDIIIKIHFRRRKIYLQQ